MDTTEAKRLLKRLLIALAALAALLGAAVVSAFAYDTARGDVVARGVTAGGVEIGGLSVDDARAKLAAELDERLQEPVAVEYRDRSFPVSPASVEVRLDVDATVRRALHESDGNFLARAGRDLLGLADDRAVPANVTYSRSALAAEVDRIARAIARRPRDARLSFARGRLRAVAERDGLAVRRGKLERALGQALTDPNGERLVRVEAEVVKAKVTREELAAKNRNFIVVSRPEKKLRFYRKLKLVETYPIAVGQAGLETPAGLYEIESKAVNPAWQVPERAWAGALAGKTIPPGSPDNPIKARWMEFHDGAGIHGTDDIASLGQAASHGCIRMSIPDVVELYERVSLQTPVYIA